jgi:hypothetical protein
VRSRAVLTDSSTTAFFLSSLRTVSVLKPRLLDGDIGAEEIGHRHHPDQGAIIVQHGKTTYFVLEQQLPSLSERGLAFHRRHVGVHNVLDPQGHQP